MKSGLIQQQIFCKETKMVYLYNKANTKKIKLCNENIYSRFNCIDDEGYKYELTSVKHATLLSTLFTEPISRKSKHFTPLRTTEY